MIHPLYKSIFIAALLTAAPLSAQTLPGMMQLTTHPADDYDAAVSPDGRWLAFVSTRSGNADIWVKPLPLGRAVQVTHHQSVESQPVWKPNGKVLVFVSTRRDAQGDLWRIGFDAQRGRPHGKPRQLTTHLGIDRDPAYSPDGNYVYFTSDRDGSLSLWRRRRGSGDMERLGPGTQPSLSPDGQWLAYSDRRGRVHVSSLVSPDFQSSPSDLSDCLEGPVAWLPDSRTLALVRIDADRDGDGMLTPADAGALWQSALFDGGRLGPGIKWSTGLANESHPAVIDSTRLVFTAGPHGKRDLWTLPLGGLFPRQETAEQQYQLAVRQTGLWTTAQGLEQAVLGYRRVSDYFPNASLWIGKAQLQEAELYISMGRELEAAALLDSLIVRRNGHALTAQQARMKMATLQHIPVNRRMGLCRAVIASAVSPRLVAEAWLVSGELHRQMGDENAAFTAFEQAASQVSRRDNLWARATLNLGDFWRDVGEVDAAQQQYLAVLDAFDFSPLWRQRASSRLWALLPKAVGERVVALRQVAGLPEATPAIQAMTVLETAAVLERANRFDQAQRELERLSHDEGVPQWARLEARFHLARVLEASNQTEAAIVLLEAMSGETGALTTDPSALLARERLFESYMGSARRLMAAEDFRLAESRARRAVALKPEHINARRLWIESAYRGGRIDAVMQKLDAALKGDAENAVLLYSLGLAYSYKGERQSGALETSNRLLSRALAQDYALVHPYRTLSFNYEAMEQHAEEAARVNPGFFKKVGKAVLGPLRWLYGLLPWTEEAVQPAYYELAIDALTTAIALNDERQDPVMEAALAQNLANNFYNLGEFGFSKAYQYYRVRLALDSTFTQPRQDAVIHERAGRCAMYLDEHAVAESYLKRAISVFTEIGLPAQALKNRRILAFLYYLSGDYERAIASYVRLVHEDEAARRWQDAETDLRNIAFYYHLLGEPKDALRYAYRAAEILERTPIPLKASPTSKLRLEIFGLSIPIWGIEEIGGASSEGLTRADEAALVYGLISRSAEALKDHNTAVRYEEKRLAIARGRKDGLAERISLNRIARLRFNQRQWALAWDDFVQVHRMAGEKSDAQGRFIAAQNLAETALALHQQGNGQTQVDQAVLLLKKDLKVLQETPASERRQLALHDLLGRLYSLDAPASEDRYMGRILQDHMRRLSALSEAETHWQRALALSQHFGPHDAAFRLYIGLAEINIALGDWAQAQDYLLQCRARFSHGDHAENLWRLALVEARLARARGDDHVVTRYQESIQALQLAPLRPERAGEKWVDGVARRALFIEAVEVLAEAGETESALTLLEQGRQQWAADMILRHPPEWKRERHKILWGNLSYTRLRLQELEVALKQARQAGERYVQIKALETEQQRLREERMALSDDFEKEDAVLAYLAGVHAQNIPAFQKTLRSGEGALVLMAGAEETLIWEVGQEAVHLRVLPHGEAYWRDRAALLERAMQTRDAAADSLLQSLYTVLLDASNPFIDGCNRLIVVPDGPLWRLPFCALGRSGEVLLDRVSLVYAPSLAEYALAWQRRKIRGSNTVVVGAMTEHWLEDVVGSATRLLGPELATESAVKTAMTHTDRLHLGRWRRRAAADPHSAGVVLYPGGGEDGFLSTLELFSQDASAGLVVLPAERPYSPEGWEETAALTRALLYARVPTVVAPRWPMTSAVQAAWTSAFYTALETLPVDEAVAEAQMILRESALHSADWAGFDVWGYGGLYPRETAGFARSNLALKVRRGRAFEQEKAYDEALLQYREALGMAQVLADSSVMRRIHQERLRAAMKNEAWAQAAEIQNTLLVWVKASVDQAAWERAMKNLLAFHQRAGHYHRAAEAQLALLNLHSQKDDADRGGDLELLAMIYGQARDWPEAMRWADEACQYHRRAGDDLALGRAMLRKGRLALEAERFWAARDALSEGLMHILMNGDMADTQMKYEIASGHQLLGLTEERLTRYSEARKHQLESEKLFKVLARPLKAAQAGQYLANLDWKEGRYRAALLKQQRVVTVVDSMKAGKQQAMAYTTLGLIHMGLGDGVKARMLMTQALALATQANEQADQAAIEKNLGLLALADRQYIQAAEHFNGAAAIDSTLDSRRGLGYDLRHLGMLDMKYGRMAQARARLTRALQLSKSVSDLRNAAQCYLGLGMLGFNKAATAALDSALILTMALDVPEVRWRLFYQRARQHAAALHPLLAADDYESAIQIIEAMRQTLGAESFKQGFLNDKMDVYEEYINFLVGENRPGDALNVVERAKSRGLVDLLGNTAVNLHSEGSDAAKALQRSEADVREAQSRLGEWAGRDDLNAREKALQAQWEAALAQRRNAYMTAKTALEAASPELASLVAVDPLSFEDIQRLLPDSTAMLLYHTGSEKIHIWAVTATQVVAATVECADTVLAATLADFREQIRLRLSSDREARQLWQWLVAPVAAQLSAARHCVVVPHGVLHYCPFAALMDEDGAYLIEKASLSLSPSATVLSFCLDKGRPVRDWIDKTTVMAFANPATEALDLPFADKEVTALKRTFGSADSLSGASVTEAVVRERAGNYGLLHFACHGVYEAGSPLFSALLLTPAGEDDGRLEAREIFGLQLKSQLVTLSACETGMSTVTRGDEIIGLARGFIYAGTPALVSSLWKVDDLATAVMMKRFYRSLKLGMPRAASLRQAQLAVMENIGRDPALWAAFSVTGDFR